MREVSARVTAAAGVPRRRGTGGTDADMIHPPRRAISRSAPHPASTSAEAMSARWLAPLPIAPRRRWISRRLFAIIVLLAGASEARRVVAHTSARPKAPARVEIRVQDYSFSHGLSNEKHIAIDSKDLKGSELDSELDPVIVIGNSGVDEVDRVDQTPVRRHDYREQWRSGVVLHDNAIVDDDDDPPQHGEEEEDEAELVDQVFSYTEEAWWWTPQQKEELTVEEQAAVLAVVVSGLLVVALVFAAVWHVLSFAWHAIQERRLMNRLFCESDPDQLDEYVKQFPITSSLSIKHVASVRLRHLRVATNAQQLRVLIEGVTFDEEELDLSPLPEHPKTYKSMTFADILSKVEEISCTGDQVIVELMQLTVPPQCAQYVDVKSWQQTTDDSIQALHKQASRIHELSVTLADTLLAKINAGKVISKDKFLTLLATLRQSSNPNESDAPYRTWSSSSNGGGGKDEFNFLLKAYDEVAARNQVKRDLTAAIETYRVGASEHHQGEIVLADNRSRPQMIGSSDNAMITRKLERFVDKAEELEMTYVDEVEHAQSMLEGARRDNFCAKFVNRDQKDLSNVKALARTFVDMGADQQAAILKAGEIVANRSNTMFLVSSLSGMFDQLRHRDLEKMIERRNRDRIKAEEKQGRMMQKFKHKQQLIAEKIEQTRLAQKLKEEEDLKKRLELERMELQRQRKVERTNFVWRITKIDVLVVLVVMAVVFFENLRQIAFIKPLCSPDDEKRWWMISWWTPDSLAVFSCELAYGFKVVGILLLLGIVFFVFAQLNIVVAVLPILGAATLYYLRAEWMNMLFRLPLLFVIYAFNLAVLYIANRGIEGEVSYATKRQALLFLVFPVASLALTLVTSVAIACDDPEQCVMSAYETSVPLMEGLWSMVRGAYRL